MTTNTVSQSDMERVYQAMRTPKKLGFVLSDSQAGIDCCTIFRAGGEWRMLYSLHNGEGPEEYRGYETWMARSGDLLSWEPMGAVLPQTRCGWDGLQADGGIALNDTDWGGSYEPGTYEGRYYMSYFGNNLPGYEPDPLSIGIADTDSLLTARPWHRQPHPVLTKDDSDAREFERRTLYKSFIMEDREKSLGARFIMYYNAKAGPFGIEKIGMAVSDDMVTWRRYGENFVVESGLPDTGWHIAGDPQIIRFEDLWVMNYFAAHSFGGSPAAHDTFAVSRDLVNWTSWKGEPLVAPSIAEDRKFAHKPFLIKWNGRVYHFYCAVGEKGRGLAVAVSE